MISEIVKLHFRSPLHITKRGVGMEATESYLPSDTLFGALCNAWGRLFGREQLESLLKAFNNGEDRPFRISSGFPFLGNTYFLPRPYSHPRPLSGFLTEETRKSLKECEFFEKDIFEKWIIGEPFGVSEYERVEQSKRKLKGEIFDDLRPRNRMDRITDHAQLFFCGTTRFPKDAGLYSMVDVAKDYKEKLEGAFHFLGEMGVGGERKIGMGRFEAEWDSLKITEPDGSTHYLTLSLYYPTEKELEGISDILYCYDLVQHGGFSESPFIKGQVRRKSCRMFKEGSVFEKDVKGRLVDVTPDKPKLSHPIYRYGIAFNVGVKIEED